MKKFFLLLGVAVLFLLVFYFLLISFPRPMGLWRLLALVVLGTAGFFAFCEALNVFYNACRTAIAQRRLRRRFQEKDKLFESCRMS